MLRLPVTMETVRYWKSRAGRGLILALPFVLIALALTVLFAAFGV